MRVDVASSGARQLTLAQIRPRRSDVSVFTIALLLAVLASVVDVFNFLDRGTAVRYLILVVPLAGLAVARLQRPNLLIRYPTFGDVLVILLVLYGLGGALFGATFLGTQQTARPVFLPLVIGFAPIFLLDTPSDAEVDRIFRWLSGISTLYVVLNFVVNLNLIGGLAEYRQFRNASFAFVALALGCAVIRRQWLKLAVLSVLVAGIFATYPSATSALMLAGTCLTLFMTGRRATGLRAWIIVLGIVTTSAFLVVNYQSAVSLASSYIDLVDKAHTETGRLELWLDGLATFEESPIVGSAFSGDIVTIRERDGETIPYHNDFVLFLAEGGIVGLGLLLAWIVFVETTLLRRHRRYRDAGQRPQAQLTRAILIVLNGFFVAMAFNPVLSGITRSAAIFGLSAIALSLGNPHVPRGGWAVSDGAEASSI
jgi:O-antigen ligase/polysaccharide polymerase Wzy-like membrane protein